MKLSNLLENIDVLQINGEQEGEVSSVCYESQRCDRGSLFVAVPGHSRDGHDFILDALARGTGFIVHEKQFHPPVGVTAIRVADSRRTLGSLGKFFYAHPSANLCLVGVLGTNGKTTVTYLLESIFEAAGHHSGVLGTVNYRYRGKAWPALHTTPESLDFQRILREMANHGVTHAIAEVSSHAVALGRVDDCAFDLGIFTNFSQDHLDYHRTMEDYFQAKLRFFTEILPRGGKQRPLRLAVNVDDSWGQRVFREAGLPGLTFGLTPGSDVRGEIVSLTAAGTEAIVHSSQGALPVFSPLVGRFNLYNILAAVAAALSLGVPEDAIKTGVAALTSVPGRLQRVNLTTEPTVFIDFAHTPDALLRVLQHLAEFCRGRIITVFGCGGDRDRGKRPLMGNTAASHSDLTIVTSDNPRGEEPMAIISEIEDGIDREKVGCLAPEEIFAVAGGKYYTVVPDRQRAVELAVSLAKKEDTILIAGKGHEDYQIIGEARLPFNDCLAARTALDARRVLTKCS